MVGWGLCECCHSPSDWMAEIAGGTLLPQQTGACVCAHQRACQCCTLPLSPYPCMSHTHMDMDWYRGSAPFKLLALLRFSLTHQRGRFQGSVFRKSSIRAPLLCHPVSSHSLFPIRRVHQGTWSPHVWSSAVRYCKIWYRSVSQYRQYQYRY